VRAYFVSGVGERKEGEEYTLERKSYHVTKTQHEIPKNTRLLAKIVIERGHPYLVFWLEEEERTYPLAKEDPRVILRRFWEAKNFKQLLRHVNSIGLTTDFYKDNVFIKSIPLPYEEYPPKVRRVLREVRDIHRDLTGFGRFIFQYYGEEGRIHNYRIWWLLPTIYLFDTEIANEVDKILGMLD